MTARVAREVEGGVLSWARRCLRTSSNPWLMMTGSPDYHEISDIAEGHLGKLLVAKATFRRGRSWDGVKREEENKERKRREDWEIASTQSIQDGLVWASVACIRSPRGQ
jgi:hypothetical protein